MPYEFAGRPEPRSYTSARGRVGAGIDFHTVTRRRKTSPPPLCRPGESHPHSLSDSLVNHLHNSLYSVLCIMDNPREQLDRLFAFDAGCSVFLGILSLLSPHGIWTSLFSGSYNHSVHETLRLYGCLRLACGWILWHARAVDDGKFRKHICEALSVCYTLQSLAVLRAQFTDRHTLVNWLAIFLLSTMAAAYGSFRFRKGGNLIKIYELPTGSNLR